ncbi:peptide-methionine (S)-S-oxide reductase MsrA [Granulicella cerasi]|uniref:Peptide methionine sulfoxide reductase MsrA n=1 Tax=Granulicella cerasi TaxID=741063 RepID=A0ABW1ZE08_9BACT|nr:peptide-methionine (S)-S-oxide reductase MsrA [Granulicella cerasi]
MSIFSKPKRTEPIPAPLHDIVAPEAGYDAGQTETAVFAGGCFWGVQSVFQRVRGVIDTEVGYTGGAAETANYRTVCEDWTGHAEAIRITFDPNVVTYGTLLRILFSVVSDPTQANGQGNDLGTSYRSSIFTSDEQQARVASEYIAQLDAAHVFHAPIVTKIEPLIAFYRGEEYHQDFGMKNPAHPYVQVCDVPKVAALETQFPELLQEYRQR